MPEIISPSDMPKTVLKIVMILTILWHPTAIFAGPPQLPAAFYGNITADNPTTLNPNTIVVAAIDGVEYARGSVFNNEDGWVYTLKVPADDPSTEAIDGGRPGDTVTFIIDGQTLATATWQGGSNTEVNLTISVAEATVQPETAGSPQWLPWLLVVLALLLIFVFWFLFARPRLRKA